MAIVFSLPWALLMWSMCSFFIALVMSCRALGDISIRVPVSLAMYTTISFTFFAILILFKSDDMFGGDIATLMSTCDSIFASVKRFALSIFTSSDPDHTGPSQSPHSGRYRQHTR
ncbi:hypothetical protein BJV78DRAFT_239511 [Lactifluus subvellereus]|nr:hypothetical protein BJV78DRAFT_239511 [Lactifluus subvellereus]